MTIVDDLIGQRNELADKMDLLIQQVNDRGGSQLRASEQRAFEASERAIGAIDARLEQVRTQQQAQARAAEARTRLGLGYGNDVTVRSEPTTYGRGSGNSYFRDLAMCAVRMDPDAGERLARHAKEMGVEARANPSGAVARAMGAVENRTGLTTAVGSGGTFLPPAYLLEEAIELPRPERVLSSLVQQENLPKGPMTIEIPKITAGTAVASQATQNTAATEVDLTDAYVSANVQTLAGQQTVSLQAIEQSAIPFDEIVFRDLLRALDAQVELQSWQGTGTSGQLAGVTGLSGVNTITYTDSTPTAVKSWPFISQAKSAVFKSIFRPADAIFMTPDRWAWYESAVDNNGRPLVLPVEQGIFAAMGQVTGQMWNGPRPVGTMQGLPVYVAPQMPTNLGAGTNQDEIAVMSTKDSILWQSAPVSRALPQTLGGSLAVILQVYQYVAFMPNRLAASISLITGTGLVPAAF